MKILKKILKYLSRFIIGSLVLLCLLSLVNTTILKKPYVNVFGYTFFVVASGSMSGTIDVNDMVIIKITDDFKTNDVITYSKDGYFITHRVISTNENQVITKGDVNTSEDEPFTRDKVIGKVVYIFPFIATFEILGSIILIALIIIIFNFEKIFKKYIFKKDIKKISNIDIEEDDQEYNEFIRKTLVLIRNRNNKTVKATLSNNWIVRLRYVTKASELLKMGKYTVLANLIDSYQYRIDADEEIFPPTIIEQLKKESINTYIILLLNTIIYEDRETYDLIYKYFKEKLHHDYLDIEII